MSEESLFELALNALAADRAALLDRECAGNPELRARIEALLRASAKDSNFLEGTGAFDPGPNDAKPCGEATVTFNADKTSRPEGTSQTEALGSVVAGRYTLIETIGE